MANWIKVAESIGRGGSQFPIASGVVVNPGDLINLNSSGQIVLADKTTGPQKALGAAFFPDDLGSGAARTGVAALTVKCAIARRGVLNGFSGLTIGNDVFLSTAGAYTQTAPATAGDIYQKVGTAVAADTINLQVSPYFTKFQTAANTTMALATA